MADALTKCPKFLIQPAPSQARQVPAWPHSCARVGAVAAWGPRWLAPGGGDADTGRRAAFSFFLFVLFCLFCFVCFVAMPGSLFHKLRPTEGCSVNSLYPEMWPGEARHQSSSLRCGLKRSGRIHS